MTSIDERSGSKKRKGYQAGINLESEKKRPQCRKKAILESATSESEESDGETVQDTVSQRKKKKMTQESKNNETENVKKHFSDSNSGNQNNIGTVVCDVSGKKRKKKTNSVENLEASEESVSGAESDYIDVETVEEVNEEITETNTKTTDIEPSKFQNDQNSISQSEKNQIQEEKETRLDQDVAHNSQRESTKACDGTTDNYATITKISTSQETDPNYSDEEIVVDDDVEPSLSSFIVVDEANSTIVDDADYVEVVSSDSDNNFKDLRDVGKDMELANCNINPSGEGNSDEIVNVDETSASNSTNMQRDYFEFDVDAIQRTQTDDPEAWKVSHLDRMVELNIGRSKGPRCNRCRQFGHVGVRCPEKTGPPRCSLCGAIGHQEPRCTNKICTQCGNKGDYSTSYCWKCFKFRNSVCKICNMWGHIAKTCPDLWRRYHLTTKEGPIVTSQGPQLKRRDQQWCSGCAQRGHLEHECNYINKQYSPSVPYIISYEDVLSQENSAILSDDISVPMEEILDSQDESSADYVLPQNMGCFTILSESEESNASSGDPAKNINPSKINTIPHVELRRHVTNTSDSHIVPVISLLSSDSSEDSASDVEETEDGPIVVSREGQLKPRDKQWCSGCAKQGHLEYECNYYNRMYPPNNPRIMSYEDVLYDNRRRPNEVVPL
ncbi:hypothetical protein NQ318_009271 [Aromia moschata]|uniref:Zinc finger CCHC domain-containing protein 7 n=1 Tax=Aromia moschata TaxID=1265417 RepID=A0AAV8YIS4_9CUCU|nr:hypothetical protein NQ318_009271 [Aromia moschata]